MGGSTSVPNGLSRHTASVEDTESTVRGFFDEVFNRGNLDAIDDLIAGDHRNHDPTAPDVPDGPKGVRKLAELYRSAFPDIQFELEEVITIGDRVAHRWTFTGTHRGEIMGVQSTGNRVQVQGLEINRVANAKIAESWAISDALGMLKQLGVEVPE